MISHIHMLPEIVLWSGRPAMDLFIQSLVRKTDEGISHQTVGEGALNCEDRKNLDGMTWKDVAIRTIHFMYKYVIYYCLTIAQ